MTAANYFYRENSDRTIDSICPRCFQTIAKGPMVEHLRSAEDEHACAALEGVESSSHSQRHTY
jgi:hypothetical protein